MVSAVYEGSMEGPGLLFADMTFFLWEKVPTRELLMRDIRINGGSIVGLADADIVIYDKIRPKLSPAGSLDWQYIAHSVKRGVLENTADHLVHDGLSSTQAPSRDQRPSMAIRARSRPGRASRTAYTTADDRFLLLWIQKAKAIGMATEGNILFVQMHAANPRHPAQSWQARWTKTLIHKENPHIPDDGSVGPVMEYVQSQPSKPRGYAVREAASGADGVDKDSTGSPPSLGLDATELRAREFTADDDFLLNMERDNIMDKAKNGPDGIDVWAEFEAQHGRHTASDWFNRFCTLEKATSELPHVASSPSPSHNTVVALDPDDSNDDAWSDLGSIASFTEPYPSSAPGLQPAAQLPLPRARDSCPLDDCPSSSERDAVGNTFDEFPPSSHTAEPSTVVTSTYGIVADSEGATHGNHVDEAAFLRCLAATHGGTIQPSFDVCDVSVRLYDVWNIVNQWHGMQNVDLCQLWPMVAKVLGFIDSGHLYAPWEIRSLYQRFSLQLCCHLSPCSPEAHEPSFSSSATQPEAVHTDRGTIETLESMHDDLTNNRVQYSSILGAGLHTMNPVAGDSYHRGSTPSKDHRHAVLGTGAPMPLTPIPRTVHRLSNVIPAPTRSMSRRPRAVPLLNVGNREVTGPVESLSQEETIWLTKFITFLEEYTGLDIQGSGLKIRDVFFSFQEFQRTVLKCGGYHSVTASFGWTVIATQLGYPPQRTQVLGTMLRKRYEDYLLKFDEWSADDGSQTNPRRQHLISDKGALFVKKRKTAIEDFIVRPTTYAGAGLDVDTRALAHKSNYTSSHTKRTRLGDSQSSKLNVPRRLVAH